MTGICIDFKCGSSSCTKRRISVSPSQVARSLSSEHFLLVEATPFRAVVVARPERPTNAGTRKRRRAELGDREDGTENSELFISLLGRIRKTYDAQADAARASDDVRGASSRAAPWPSSSPGSFGVSGWRFDAISEIALVRGVPNRAVNPRCLGMRRVAAVTATTVRAGEALFNAKSIDLVHRHQPHHHQPPWNRPQTRRNRQPASYLNKSP
jgi:hypothetical protein